MFSINGLRGALVALLVLLAGHGAQAAERLPFDAASFSAAQSRGAPILVEVTAPWCPTCRAQKPILAELGSRPAHKDLVIFALDFDSQKQDLRKFNAQSQSTLIAFRGAVETARSVGDTNPTSIAQLLDSTLAR
jgi:thioredoxin 1